MNKLVVLLNASFFLLAHHCFAVSQSTTDLKTLEQSVNDVATKLMKTSNLKTLFSKLKEEAINKGVGSPYVWVAQIVYKTPDKKTVDKVIMKVNANTDVIEKNLYPTNTDPKFTAWANAGKHIIDALKNKDSAWIQEFPLNNPFGFKQKTYVKKVRKNDTDYLIGTDTLNVTKSEQNVVTALD